MIGNLCRAAVLLIILTIAPTASAQAAGRVTLEIVTAPNFQALETRNWYQLLTELKVDGLRIRSQRASDRMDVKTTGGGTSPTYHVTGMLNESGELLLPGGRFTLRDGGKLAEWLQRMREHGPEGENTEDTSATFGLNKTELGKVYSALGAKIDFDTAGVDRGQLVEQLVKNVRLPVSIGAGLGAALQEAGPVQTQLRGMAVGTALAYVLRPAGWSLLPRKGRDGLSFQLVPSRSAKMVWPIGLDAEDRRRELMPGMFEIINVSIDKGTPLAKVLPVLKERLDVPLLLDHNRMAAKGIDPEKAGVFIPPRKTSVSVLLNSTLTQARLKAQLRTDEADQPFYWITTFQ